MADDDWIRRFAIGFAAGIGCLALPFALFAATIGGALAYAVTGSAVVGWLTGIGFAVFLYSLLFEL